jgi:hypothetical protein
MAIFMLSCKSVKKGVRDNEVYLYKGQAKFMNGNYFIKPYAHNGNYKSLIDIFELDEASNTEMVNFDFISDEKLEINYSDGLKSYSKIVKGKMKNGAFRYKSKTLPLGIPLILFTYQRRIHHIALGNDDNIIITEYSYSNNHFLFTGMSEKRVENKYYFDRQLKL